MTATGSIPLTSSDFRKALDDLQTLRSQLLRPHISGEEPGSAPAGLARESDPLAHTCPAPAGVSTWRGAHDLQQESQQLRVQWQSDVSRLEQELAAQRAALASAQAQSATAPAASSAEPSGAELEREMFRELEGLELALVEERGRSATALEERDAAISAHNRDVEVLEGMLARMGGENEELREDNARLSAQLAVLHVARRERQLNAPALISPAKAKGFDQESGPPSPARSMEEPEVERSARSIDMERFCVINPVQVSLDTDSSIW